MRHKQSTYSAVLAPILVTLMLAVGAPATAQSGPEITDTPAFDAPIGEKGGVMNPVPYCSDYSVEPRARWVLTNIETGYSRTFRWRGAYPGMYFPRVKVGTYRSETVAWCGNDRTRRVERVEVEQKTHQTTVSKAEFRRIKVGMTPQRVRQIVGYGGWVSPPFNGERTRTYDMMAFWRWSVVVFKDGKVTKKYWDTDHD